MKKKLFLAMMAIVAVFATLSFSACSSDDDDNNNGGGSGSSASYKVTPIAAIAPDMLDLFDVTATVGGKTVNLTTENTEVKTIPVNNEDREVRIYSFDTIESSSVTATLSITTKFKEGVDFASHPKSDYCLAPVFYIVNGNKTAYMSTSVVTTKGVIWSKLTDATKGRFEKTVSPTLTISNGKIVFK